MAGAVLAVGLAAKPARAETVGSWLTDSLSVGLAFLTNLAIHESGHFLMAEGVGASETSLRFFSHQGGAFFLGLSTAKDVPEESSLPYRLGGEIACSQTFEFALHAYRHHPTTYNSALLFFSGTDFFWYTLYAFYLAPHEDPRYDPVGIRDVTGFSRPAIVAAASAQFLTNLYRVRSGHDTVTPSFAFDQRSAVLTMTFRF